MLDDGGQPGDVSNQGLAADDLQLIPGEGAKAHALAEGPGEQGEVPKAFTQGGHANGDNMGPVVEIFPNTPGGEEGLRVMPGGRDQPNGRVEKVVLQDPEQGDLVGMVQVGQFIDIEGPPPCLGHQPPGGLVRILWLSEEAALDPVRVARGGDRNKRGVFSKTHLMEGPGGQVFA